MLNMREIRFTKNDRDMVRAVCVGVEDRKCLWICYASTVNGSSMVQFKTYVHDHTCRTFEQNIHVNSKWLSERYATQLSKIYNWNMGSFKDQVKEDLCVIA